MAKDDNDDQGDGENEAVEEIEGAEETVDDPKNALHGPQSTEIKFSISKILGIGRLIL